MDDDRLAAIAKSLAHPARLHIVRLLARQQECRGADVFSELPLAQSTISQHLAVLREAGVVSSHSVGQGHVYCLDPGALRVFAGDIVSLVALTPACSLDSEECR